MGMNTWVRSWVPSGPIHGMVIRHGEAFSISERLTVEERAAPVYRPTVHYAYCPCDSAIASLTELRGNNYRLQPRQRIVTDEITTGSDALGALLMGHPFTSWWIGSDLSIEESRRLVPHQNATTMQVAISVVGRGGMDDPATRSAACCCRRTCRTTTSWISPARTWVTFISTPSDWTPLKELPTPFEGYNSPDFDLTDPWQFKNFLVKEGD